MTAFDRLCARVREVLLHQWDPVGISDVPAVHDEYDPYVVPIARMVEDGDSVAAIASHLLKLEFEITGMQSNNERASVVAKRLRELRDQG